MVLTHFLICAIVISLRDIQYHRIRRVHIYLALLTLLPAIDKTGVQFAVLNTFLYLAIYWASDRQMGFGDVRLAALIGAYCGIWFSDLSDLLWANLFTWVLASAMVMSGFVSGKVTFSSQIAFAPHMFMGLWLVHYIQ